MMSLISKVHNLFRGRHAYLLAGYTNAGKSSLLNAFRAVATNRRSPNHEEPETTIGKEMERGLKIRDMTIDVDSGSGNLGGQQKDRFKRFIKEALKKPTKHTALFVVDITKVGNKEEIKHTQSEFCLLQHTVKAVQVETKKNKKLKMIIVGSHYDQVAEDDRESKRQLLLQQCYEFVPADLFDVDFEVGNLKDEKERKKVIKRLMDKSLMEERE